MTKLAFLFQLGAAGVLAVPVLVDGDGETTAELRASLARTVAALEELAGLERAAAEGALDVDRVLAAVPAPTLDERERDERLTSLTADISRLKELARERLLAATRDPEPAPEPVAPEVDEPPAQPVDETPAGASPETEAPELAPEHRAFEDPGFSADPLRHGQAYYHAGRYEDAIAVLEKLGDDPVGVYWTGRALERLGRSTLALEHYRRVAESDAAEHLRERAAQDLEFLEWKVRFESRRESRGRTSGGASR